MSETTTLARLKLFNSNSYAEFRYSPGGLGDPALSGDLNVTTSGWCYGQIRGNPDIAGWGFIISILIGSVASILLTLVTAWWPYIQQRWQEIDDPRSQNRPYNANLVSMRLGARYFAPENARISPELTTIEKAIFALGDLNLTVALSIIVAVLINELNDANFPLYHTFLARALVSVALAGHSIARPIYSLPQTSRKWSVRMRSTLTVITLTLYLFWSYTSYSKFRVMEDSWNRDQLTFMPMCLSAHHIQVVPFSFSFWIALSFFWIPWGYGPVLFSPISLLSDRSSTIVRLLDDRTLKLLRNLDIAWRSLYKDPPVTALRSRLWYDTKSLARLLGMLVMAMLWLCAQTLIGLGDAFLPLNAFFLDIGWNTLDIYNIKKSNEGSLVASFAGQDGILSNPEQEWGIGQIIPMIMFLQVVLIVFDASVGESSSGRR